MKFMKFVVPASILSICFAISPSNSLGQDILFGDVLVQLDLFASNVAETSRAPSDILPLNDGAERLAVSTLNGLVRLLGSDGSLLDTAAQPFLDTRTEDSLYDSSFGMTAIAPHPDFNQFGSPGYGKLYSIGTENFATASADFPTPATPILTSGAHQDVIYEWTTNTPSVTNPIWLKRELMRFDQPHREHNVLDLAFDTEGLLYISSGDGGFSGTHSTRGLRSQDLSNHHGTVMRIDPLAPNSTDKTNVVPSINGNYSVPEDNPFASDADEQTLAEIYAYGLRSPYRMNFDRLTGDLYIGDVGEAKREEVSQIEAGGNYGWGYFEGTVPGVSGVPPAGLELESPLFDYGRDDGRTVVGGFVYRGSLIPELQGKYIFGDYGFQGNPNQTPSRLFYGDIDTGEIFEIVIDPAGVEIADVVSPGKGTTLQAIISVGEDSNGELYLSTHPGGKILKLVPATSRADFDNNGEIDGADFLTWQRGFTIGSVLDDGDATGDGIVNGDDLKIWKTQFGDQQAEIIKSIGVVPEPSTLLLFLSSLIVYSMRRCRIEMSAM